LKSWKWKYYDGKLEEGLKLRSLEMLAHRKMENHDFSCAQECSNDRVPSQHFDHSFYKGDVIRMMPYWLQYTLTLHMFTVHILFYRLDTYQNSTIMGQTLFRVFNDGKTSHHY